MVMMSDTLTIAADPKHLGARIGFISVRQRRHLQVDGHDVR